jgi:protein subunit release factor A
LVAQCQGQNRSTKWDKALNVLRSRLYEQKELAKKEAEDATKELLKDWFWWPFSLKIELYNYARKGRYRSQNRFDIIWLRKLYEWWHYKKLLKNYKLVNNTEKLKKAKFSNNLNIKKKAGNYFNLFFNYNSCKYSY